MLKFRVIFALLAFTNFSLYSEISLGEKLETQMWEDFKNRNFTNVENNISQNFQSVHTFGALNRAAEVDLIKELFLEYYKISNLQSTENPETITVSYLISVKEKIRNKLLSEEPSPRLSVWQKIEGRWQWIAHSNLMEIPYKMAGTIAKPINEIDR